MNYIAILRVSACLGDRQPGPPREVLDGGRSLAGDAGTRDAACGGVLGQWSDCG